MISIKSRWLATGSCCGLKILFRISNFLFVITSTGSCFNLIYIIRSYFIYDLYEQKWIIYFVWTETCTNHMELRLSELLIEPIKSTYLNTNSYYLDNKAQVTRNRWSIIRIVWPPMDSDRYTSPLETTWIRIIRLIWIYLIPYHYYIKISLSLLFPN